jgi:5-methyltetrahydrofolate--homocysteine methyltransferase
MTREEFRLMTEKGTVLLDGGTGSCLRTMGMPVGVCSELWIYEHPDVMKTLQDQYMEAGSAIIYAPTFGANRASLRNLGLEDKTEELNHTLVARTLANAAGKALVAGDMSTTGKAMEPYGPMTYDGLLEIYTEQIRLLSEAGADLLVAETLLALDEALVICDAARSVCDLPLMISFSCESDGSLYFGGTVYDAAAALEAMGVDAVGVNCSVGPDQLEAVVQNLHRTVSVPIITKPNAGVPAITKTGEAVYSMKEEEFSGHLKHLVECGASIVGGCCGTTPDYIRKVKKLL